MKGNFPVRFLEGGGLATARFHSAPASRGRVQQHINLLSQKHNLAHKLHHALRNSPARLKEDLEAVKLDAPSGEARCDVVHCLALSESDVFTTDNLDGGIYLISLPLR